MQLWPISKVLAWRYPLIGLIWKKFLYLIYASYQTIEEWNNRAFVWNLKQLVSRVNVFIYLAQNATSAWSVHSVFHNHFWTWDGSKTFWSHLCNLYRLASKGKLASLWPPASFSLLMLFLFMVRFSRYLYLVIIAVNKRDPWSGNERHKSEVKKGLEISEGRQCWEELEIR